MEREQQVDVWCVCVWVAICMQGLCTYPLGVMHGESVCRPCRKRHYAVNITFFCDMTPCSLVDKYSSSFLQLPLLRFRISTLLWDSSLSIVTKTRVGQSEFDSRHRRRPFSSPQRPDRLWGPPSLLSSGQGVSFFGSKAAGA
jgi:hypothetical protein